MKQTCIVHTNRHEIGFSTYPAMLSQISILKSISNENFKTIYFNSIQPFI